MAYIYESDVGRLGGNLQKTVGYLLSLHKAEYEWNLLGIKVVGHVDALPIPDGTYEYGDAYTVGTAAPYDMWIYTRADAFHSEAYWFNIGKFPAPGPQGPKGDGLEQIAREASNTAQSVSYDSTSGATIEYTDKTLIYKDSTTGETKTQTFPAQLILPFLPGKYVSMDANAENDALEIKVDDTALALDYIKLDKTKTSAIPQNNSGILSWLPTSISPTAYSLVQRDGNGNGSFTTVGIDAVASKNDLTADRVSLIELRRACNRNDAELSITKTTTDTGTVNAATIGILQYYPQLHIQYDNQTYYRMDPVSAPDGTLNYIHLDSIQNGGGTYKATGKCFSVTVSTRAWQVVDLDFGRSYTHNIIIENGSTGDFIHFTLINHHPDSYVENADGLLVSIGDAKINCTVTDGARYYAGIIYQDGGYFHFEYGDSTHVQATTSQVTITDTVF